jgi:hypothetical protein
MILFWRTTKSPYATQRLGFSAPRNINRAWSEANQLRQLLARAGDYRLRDVKIIAFGVQGALAAFAQDNLIKINPGKVDSSVIQAIIARIK